MKNAKSVISFYRLKIVNKPIDYKLSSVEEIYDFIDKYKSDNSIVSCSNVMSFDDIHPDGVDQSIQHNWVEGSIVGIEVNWGDKDADPGAYDDAYWSGFGGVGASKDADQFGDYLLAPIEEGLPDTRATAVESSTWGQIKSSF